SPPFAPSRAAVMQRWHMHSMTRVDGSVTDRGTQLAEERTTFAVERTFIAFERTLMAWLRTSLSLISFGFTVAKFFQYLAEQRGEAIVGLFGRTWASDTVGLTMIAIGTFALLFAVIQHRRRVVALRARGLEQQW